MRIALFFGSDGPGAPLRVMARSCYGNPHSCAKQTRASSCLLSEDDPLETFLWTVMWGERRRVTSQSGCQLKVQSRSLRENLSDSQSRYDMSIRVSSTTASIGWPAGITGK